MRDYMNGINLPATYPFQMRPLRFLLLWLCPSVLAAADYPVRPVPFTDVTLTGGMWKTRQDINSRVTLPFALAQCETSDRLKNFDLAAETMKRRAAGETTFQNKPPTQYPFDDSDVFKVLEGAAFALAVQPDAKLSAKVDEFIRRIEAAQEPDGYLYTWRTMHPDSPAHDWIDQDRWMKDPVLSHELYNLGHLYEAGFAHFQATGSRSLLDICLKSAALVQKEFGDGEPRIAPGHQVIEMGLAKLYRQTSDKRYIDLAKFFLNARGHGGSSYSQDHQPVIKQSEAVGHAVRANYLYSGMADIAALTGDSGYHEAISKIWENVVSRKLHLTGGCGARASGEAYGDDYELPNRCYNETCAAIAFMFWNHRMFLLTGDSKYMDVFERSLYNGFLSGVSISGDRFFYPNPLEYDGREANNHGFAGRAPWFGCACCPPNVLRTMASLGGYSYAVQNDKVYVNLYAQSSATVRIESADVKLEQETAYPWEGRVDFKVAPESPKRFTLALRLPGWVQGRPLPSDLYHYEDPAAATWSVSVNNKKIAAKPEKGYLLINREWTKGDRVSLDLPMPVRRVAGNEKIAATRGQSAIERGPVVYCLEGVDNADSVFDTYLPATASFTPKARPDLLGGVSVIEIDNAGRVQRDDQEKATGKPAKLTAIPYAFWNNRGLGQMTVWMPRNPADSRPPPRKTLSSTAKISTSFQRGGMGTDALNDQLMPKNATDGFAKNFDFWPHKGTPEWIQYEFAQPTELKKATVSWFDDTGTGECRLPKSWRLTYRTESGNWKPVEATDSYAIQKSTPVDVRFAPVKTLAVRLELQLVPKFSAGLFEWEIE
jgi:uncharacterized protein